MTDVLIYIYRNQFPLEVFVKLKKEKMRFQNSNNFKKKHTGRPLKIIEGTRSTWNGSTTEGLTIRGDGDFAKFAGVVL